MWGGWWVRRRRWGRGRTRRDEACRVILISEAIAVVVQTIKAVVSLRGSRLTAERDNRVACIGR